MVFDTSFREPSPPRGVASKHASGTSTPWESGIPTKPPSTDANSGWNNNPATPERPPLFTAKTTPLGADPAHNAWADEFEDDFGQEKEVKMSFM
jgi:hypothetical protein